jgi:hypothetical protein
MTSLPVGIRLVLFFWPADLLLALQRKTSTE